MSLSVVLLVLLAVTIFLMRMLLRFGPLRAGDFFKVAIPRTLDRPLAMGTRMEVVSALNKRGVERAEIVRLADGEHDQDLLDRYWAAQPPA